MKNLLLSLSFFMFALVGSAETGIIESEPISSEDLGYCAVYYDVYYNGQWVGTHIERNHSLSCSGYGSGRIELTVAPILA